jgi:hypothetical protein
MPKLKINTLYCHTTEDSRGADEAYLVVDGQQIWGDQSINDDQGRTVNREVDFTNSVEIKLFDRDTGVWEDDDYLGIITVDETLAGQGVQEGKFTEDGADYTLYYEVEGGSRRKLKLKSLYCQKTEDTTGSDEAYLVINGEQIWGDQPINDQDPRPINIEFDFSKEVKIKLFDRDTGIFDRDDYLGTVTITEDQAGQGEKEGNFTEDGADYTLYYEVV